MQNDDEKEMSKKEKLKADIMGFLVEQISECCEEYGLAFALMLDDKYGEVAVGGTIPPELLANICKQISERVDEFGSTPKAQALTAYINRKDESLN